MTSRSISSGMLARSASLCRYRALSHLERAARRCCLGRRIGGDRTVAYTGELLAYDLPSSTKTRPPSFGSRGVTFASSDRRQAARLVLAPSSRGQTRSSDASRGSSSFSTRATEGRGRCSRSRATVAVHHGCELGVTRSRRWASVLSASKALSEGVRHGMSPCSRSCSRNDPDVHPRRDWRARAERSPRPCRKAPPCGCQGRCGLLHRLRADHLGAPQVDRAPSHVLRLRASGRGRGPPDPRQVRMLLSRSSPAGRDRARRTADDQSGLPVPETKSRGRDGSPPGGGSSPFRSRCRWRALKGRAQIAVHALPVYRGRSTTSLARPARSRPVQGRPRRGSRGATRGEVVRPALIVPRQRTSLRCCKDSAGRTTTSPSSSMNTAARSTAAQGC